MSQGDNPYRSPQSPGEAHPWPSSSVAMDYLASYSYVLKSRIWYLNLLFAAVVQFIPLIGPIVLLGYQYEIVEALVRDPRQVYPDFDWRNFVAYLSRGIWPFLVVLIAAIVVIPIAGIGFLGTMLVSGLLLGAGGDAGAVAGVLLMAVAVTMVVLIGVVMHFFAWPLQLRAGLSQDLGASFDFRWISDYLRCMWREMLMVMIFMFVSAMVMTFAGMLVCCVGIYGAVAWVMLAQAHLAFQVYRLYLARGGKPVPCKPQAV